MSSGAGWQAWIGLRYLRPRRANLFAGFISVIAMLGIALGVMALVAVLSVMNGFERELERRILDIVAHATLEGDGGRLDAWREIAAESGSGPGVVAVAPFVGGRGMLVADGARKLLLKGEREKFLTEQWPDIHATIVRLGLAEELLGDAPAAPPVPASAKEG